MGTELTVEVGFAVTRVHDNGTRQWDLSSRDLVDLVGELVDLIHDTAAVVVHVDICGIGAGVYQRLLELETAGDLAARISRFDRAARR